MTDLSDVSAERDLYRAALQEIASGLRNEVTGLTEMPRRASRRHMRKVARRALENGPSARFIAEIARRIVAEHGPAVAITDPAELAAYLRWQAEYEKTLTPAELAKFRDGMVCT